MEEQNRSFYRKDYNPNKKYFIIGAAVLVAAFVVSLLFFIGDKQEENRENLAGASGMETSTPAVPRDSEPTAVDEYQTEESTPQPQPGPQTQTEVPEQVDAGPVKAEEVDEFSRQKFVKAIKYYTGGKYEQALPLFRDLVPDHPRLEFYVGACYYKLQDYVSALEHLESALDQSPDDFTTLKYLAFSYYQRNELQSSLERCNEALDIHKDRQLLALQNRLNRELTALKGYGEAERVNFNVVFSKAEHSHARSVVIEYLEDAYRSVGRQIDFYPSDSVNVILYNEKNFFDVTRAPGWAGGLYDGKIRIPIAGFEGKEDELKRVLEHEYVHALVHAMTGKNRPPTWLNEGLAEYFSNDHGTTVGQLIPLKMLGRGFPGRPTRVVVAAYVESYSAVSYLINRYRMVSIKQCLEEMGKGKSWNQAFEKAFFVTYDRFCDTWEKE